ncbi:MAG: GyrI-like domain-containing protein [Chloroflexota bacterium]
MLKIGMFAKVGQVSIKTLHFYEKKGLLLPKHIDEFTGFRYYSIDQLPRLNRILALKGLGLSLKQIRSILQDELSADEVRGMLRLREVELEKQVSEMQAQLERVAVRITQIELEGKMSDYDVVLKTVEPILVAGRRIRVTENIEYPVGLPEAFDEACAYVETNGKQTGPGIAVWYTPMDAQEEDVEAAVPIGRPIAESDQVKVHKLPREQVASLLFKGKMDSFMQGYEAILKWIEANHYEVTGPFREVYHEFERMDDVSIEIQFPVAKASG